MPGIIKELVHSMLMKVKLSYRKTAHPRTRGGYQGWTETETADTLNVYDNTEMRTPILVVIIT